MTGSKVGMFDCTPGLGPLEKVRSSTAITVGLDTNSFEKQMQRKAECISAEEDGTVLYKLDIEPWLCNDRKAMNGASAALAIEWVSLASVLVVARPGYWAVANPTVENGAHFLGVTRNISITWCSMAPMGTPLYIRGRIQQITPRQTLVHCEAVHKESGKLIFTGTHDMQSVAGNTTATAQILAQNQATTDKLRDLKL